MARYTRQEQAEFLRNQLLIQLKQILRLTKAELENLHHPLPIHLQIGSDGKVYETGASGIPKESITHTTKADLAAHKSGVREPAPPPTNPSPDRIFVKGDQEFIINPEDGQVWRS